MLSIVVDGPLSGLQFRIFSKRLNLEGLDDGKNNMGGMIGIMVDGIDCHGFGQVLAQWAPGVGINVEAREIATRDVDPDTMPCLE